MNRIEIMGRFTKKPTIRETSGGSKFTSFVLAVPRKYKNQEGNKVTDFINVIFWGSIGETVTECFTKGDRIIVYGSLETRRYEDETGITRFSAQIVGDEFEFVDKKKDAAANMSPRLEPDQEIEVEPGPEVDSDLPFDLED